MPQYEIGSGSQFIQLYLTGTEIALETARGLRKATKVEGILAREIFKLSAKKEGARGKEREQGLLGDLTSSFHALERLGWKRAFHAPKDRGLLLIEAGSTGIHEGYRDEIGFWIVDNQDTWPSHPILYKEK